MKRFLLPLLFALALLPACNSSSSSSGDEGGTEAYREKTDDGLNAGELSAQDAEKQAGRKRTLEAGCDSILDVTWREGRREHVEKLKASSSAEPCCPPRDGWLVRMDHDPVCTEETITIRVHNAGIEPIELPGDIGFTAVLKQPGTKSDCYPVGSALKGPDPAIVVEPGRYYEIDVLVERAAKSTFCTLCLGNPGLNIVNVELEIHQATVDKLIELHWEGPALCPHEVKFGTDIDAV